MVTAATLLCLTGLLPPPVTHLQTVNEEWRTHTAVTPLQRVNQEWDTHPGFTPIRSSTTITTQAFKAPTPRGMGSNTEQWRSLISEFFPPEQVETALCVVAGESGGNPNADNPRSSAAGLFQFLRSTWDKMVPLEVTGGSYDSGMVYDPVASTRAAAWLWANLGWGQWSAYRNCR